MRQRESCEGDEISMRLSVVLYNCTAIEETDGPSVPSDGGD